MNKPSMETALVRQAMLDALGNTATPSHFNLRLRISNAADTQRLWHLRPDLMQALALTHGEGRATQSLQQITRLFPA